MLKNIFIGFLFIAVTATAIAEEYPIPLGLPPLPWPKDNPYTAKKAELGRILYFDKRISGDGTVSCASCHGVNRAFADENIISTGIKGRIGKRHAPTVINAAYEKLLFWDGRVDSLEHQAMGPIANYNEMSNSKEAKEAYSECCKRINLIPGYRPLFKDAFGDEKCTIEGIAQAIATFERTVLSGNSPYDRYMAGDKTAMNEEEIKGMQVFKRVGCDNCHFGPNFTDGTFRNIGVGMDAPNPDLGRYVVTKDKKDWGAFKVPTLRQVAYTYPYMHDGSHKTLDEVIEYYDIGGIKNNNLHPLMRPLNMTVEDKKALKAFMIALSGEGWQHVTEPDCFPK